MVKCVKLVFLLLCLCAGIQAADVRVTTELDSTRIGENQAFQVFVKVFHNEQFRVDEESFRLDGEAIQVELVATAQQSNVSIVNGRRTEDRFLTETFRFYAEGRPKGWYALSAVTVTVSGNDYSSEELSFEILSANISDELRLEAIIDGVTPLYPGQGARFIYRVYSSKPVDLTYEDLPLLKGEGFRLLGERQMRQFNRGGRRVWEITQEVQAVKPGKFTFGPSAIEAFAYQETFFGRRRYIQPRLRAEAETISLRVDAFPRNGQSQEFNGAIGEFTLHARLLSSNEVRVGDKVDLELSFSGAGEWDTIQLPSLGRQENISRSFRLSDLPPVGELRDGNKIFIVELRPLNELVEEIPSIHFSSFDPIGRRYVDMQTDPIPLVVSAGRMIERPVTELPESSEVIEEARIESPVDLVDEEPYLAPIVIHGNYRLRAGELYTVWSEIMYLPLFICLGVFVIMGQLLWRRSLVLASAQAPVEADAQALLAEARKFRTDPSKCLSLMERALRLRLRDLGILDDREQGLDSLENTGIQGGYRALLQEISEQRFAGIDGASPEALLDKVEEILHRE